MINTRTAVRNTRVGLAIGRWFLILGLAFYSLMTTTPLVASHSEWRWSGFVLGLIVDAAFIMALSAESTLAKFGMTELGGWPVVFRWFTGLSSAFLNTWGSIAKSDPVGVAIHMIAPALVMILAEVGPVFMKHLAAAEASAADEKPVTAPESVAEPVPVPVPELPTVEHVAGVQPRLIEVPMPAGRLSKAEAAAIIETGWRHKLSVKEVSEAATRHAATVSAHYRRLDAKHAALAA